MSLIPDSRFLIPVLDKLAQVLVGYSTEVKAEQLVTICAAPLAEPLVVALYREVLRAGAHPIVFMAPEACAEELCRLGSEWQLGFVSPIERLEAESADVAIHILATSNTQSLASVEPAKLALRNQARRGLMETFLQRAADGKLRWVVTQYPCHASAQAAAMALSEYEDFIFAAGMLDSADPATAWCEISKRQTALANFLSGVREIRIVVPHRTDLRLAVADRVWINCDGRNNFPDGEVFTAPIEDSTEGFVQFDFPAIHSGREAEGVRLHFRAGRVVGASASRGEDFLIRMLDQDPGARVLGEIGIGCNYAIQRYTRNTLFDEKIGGTVHLALGSAYPESGGKNASALHWDMVADLRGGGRIKADGQLISENGKFVHAGWPCA